MSIKWLTIYGQRHMWPAGDVRPPLLLLLQTLACCMASCMAFTMRAGVHIFLHASKRSGSLSTLLQTALQLAVTSATFASYSFLHPCSQDLVAGEPKPCTSLHFIEHLAVSSHTVLKRKLTAQASLQTLLEAGSLSWQKVLQVSSSIFFASAVFSTAAAPPMSFFSFASTYYECEGQHQEDHHDLHFLGNNGRGCCYWGRLIGADGGDGSFAYRTNN